MQNEPKFIHKSLLSNKGMKRKRLRKTLSLMQNIVDAMLLCLLDLTSKLFKTEQSKTLNEKNKYNMADIHKQAEEWLKAHPKATPKEIWLAGYWQSTDNWCNAKR